MKRLYYTSEKNVLLLISFLKQHGIKKIIASPGTTNITFVSSVQRDDFFEIYSCVDERSAAYMAVGMAEQSKKPVILSCTGATASRNYLPALTEAYYRKLPIIACTSTQSLDNVGHLIPQVIDRSTPPKDTVKYSINLIAIESKADIHRSELLLSKAFDALFYKGGGPIHINLETSYNRAYSSKYLRPLKVMRRVSLQDNFPPIPKGNIAIFIGSHLPMNEQETKAIETFALRYNAVVLKDHTSNYYGRNALNLVIKGAQDIKPNYTPFSLLIHIGEVSGDYCTMSLLRTTLEVWRVSADGEFKDSFRKLSKVFDMEEKDFFQKYIDLSPTKTERTDLYETCLQEKQTLFNQIPDLPFSNLYIAKFLSDKLPHNSILHLGILNSLRSWNFFDIPPFTKVFSNVGGFGIDGCLSSAVGSAIVAKERLCFLVIGDLATFYDLNVLANRHLPNNLRILLINNGLGQEFKNYNNAGAMFEQATDEYIAAKGHNGNKSTKLLKHFAEDLGFKYLSASNKEEFSTTYEEFICENTEEKPILFEIFTNEEEENQALYQMRNIYRASTKEFLIEKLKQKFSKFLK
ncbi:MAG: thiamine pyrophosphate-binding protein [Bacteroidota bacterium]|nr:thiamine pyrophosphate-binding protein [Bacteroidota bacterium]